MVTHDNIHIPGESFPHWIWFVIEFAIVLGIAALIAFQVTPTFEDAVTRQSLECVQESHESKCSLGEPAPDENLLTWIFWGIVTAIFFVWYVVIRSIILKKPILQNRG